MLENKPYFCPNCRSNRVKFNLLKRTKSSFMKDAMSGEISQLDDPVLVDDPEPVIECRVCGFEGNEQRFVRQAERDPRVPT